MSEIKINFMKEAVMSLALYSFTKVLSLWRVHYTLYYQCIKSDIYTRKSYNCQNGKV